MSFLWNWMTDMLNYLGEFIGNGKLVMHSILIIGCFLGTEMNHDSVFNTRSVYAKNEVQNRK